MSETSFEKTMDLNDFIREFGRMNWHHVNDTDKNKRWSYDMCCQVEKLLKELRDYRESNRPSTPGDEQELKTKAIKAAQDLYPSQGVHDIHNMSCLRWAFWEGVQWLRNLQPPQAGPQGGVEHE